MMALSHPLVHAFGNFDQDFYLGTHSAFKGGSLGPGITRLATTPEELTVPSKVAVRIFVACSSRNFTFLICFRLLASSSTLCPNSSSLTLTSVSTRKTSGKADSGVAVQCGNRTVRVAEVGWSCATRCPARKPGSSRRTPFTFVFSVIVPQGGNQAATRT
jgi:hypothetical protein